MKKALALIVSLALGVGAYGKGGSAVFCHFGVDGGISVNNYSSWRNNSGSNKYGWHIGGTMLMKLPAFFAIQPAVQFEQQNSMVPTAGGGQLYAMSSNGINVPVALQWGPDLGLCRPFVQLVPYLDFTLGAKYRTGKEWTAVNEYVNPVQFGLGLGAGIDIWRIQLSLRYNWSFGNWTKAGGIPGLAAFGDNRQSFMFTLGFFLK